MQKINPWLMFAGVVLALFSYICMVSSEPRGEVYLGRGVDCILECPSTQPQDHAHRDQGLGTLEDSSPAAILNTRRPYQQASIRTQRGGHFFGLCGRGNHGPAWAKSYSDNLVFKDTRGNGSYPHPLSFGASKDYYVFTLKRMLC